MAIASTPAAGDVPMPVAGAGLDAFAESIADAETEEGHSPDLPEGVHVCEIVRTFRTTAKKRCYITLLKVLQSETAEVGLTYRDIQKLNSDNEWGQKKQLGLTNQRILRSAGFADSKAFYAYAMGERGLSAADAKNELKTIIAATATSPGPFVGRYVKVVTTKKAGSAYCDNTFHVYEE